jgi:hypothetical protein
MLIAQLFQPKLITKMLLKLASQDQRRIFLSLVKYRKICFWNKLKGCIFLFFNPQITIHSFFQQEGFVLVANAKEDYYILDLTKAYNLNIDNFLKCLDLHLPSVGLGWCGGEETPPLFDPDSVYEEACYIKKNLEKSDCYSRIPDENYTKEENLNTLKLYSLIKHFRKY